METITLEVSDATKSGSILGTIKMPIEQYRKYYAFTDASFLTEEQRRTLGIRDQKALIAFSSPEEAAAWSLPLWRWLAETLHFVKRWLV